LILGVVVILTTLGTLSNLLWPTLLPKAGPTLPPRQPPAVPAPGGGDQDSAEPGAYIELHTSPALPGWWSWVEWQNSSGNWEKVDGWEGTLDGQGARRWFVAKKDFGNGPFRWIVSRGPGGTAAGTSAPFDLPTVAYQTVDVTISP
jgi:hypothetical protein